MLWVPQKGILRVEHNVGAGAATSLPGQIVVTSGTASVKGTPVELIASTAFDAYMMIIIASKYSTASTLSKGCLDILIGASTEEVLIGNLLMGNCGASGSTKGAKTWTFPLYIPAGSRIAAQAAGDRLSSDVCVAIFLYGGDGDPQFRVGGKVTTYGITTVPSAAVIVPGTTGAEGAWTEITSATSEDHFALVPSFQFNDASVTLSGLAVDIGVGAATEEEVGTYWFLIDALEACEGPLPSMPTFLDIPSGTRLVMRASNSAGVNDSSYHGAIHAVS